MLTLLMIDLENNGTTSDSEIEKMALGAFELLEAENSPEKYQTTLVEVTADKDIKVKKSNKTKELKSSITPKGKNAEFLFDRNMEDIYNGRTKRDEKPNYEHLTMIIYDNAGAFLASIESGLFVFDVNTGIYISIAVGSDKFTNFLYTYCPVSVRPQLNRNMEYKIYQALLVTCQNNRTVFTDEYISDIKNRHLLLANCVYEVDSGIYFGFTPNIPFIRKGLNIQLKPVESYNETSPQNGVFNRFLNEISNGSEQIKSLVKTLLGFIFANHEYNPKKIVILYGDKNTIRTIFKFIEYCINKECVAHIPIENLADKYAVRGLENKSINISPYVDSKGMIDKLDFIQSEYSGEYIYAGNKASELTIINDKCFLFGTGATLDIAELLKTVDSLNNILLVPISKGVEKSSDIDFKAKELFSIADYIFMDAMKSRSEIADNSWEFVQLQEVSETIIAVKEDEVETTDAEIKAFNDYLKERCDFGDKLTIIKRELKKDIGDYCRTTNRKEFNNKVIKQCVKDTVCRELGITATIYDKEYDKGNGKNIVINKKQERAFRGFSLKGNISQT